MSKVELGLVLTGVPRTRNTPTGQVRELVDLTHAARDSGFTHLIAGQHFLGAPYRYVHPLSLLTSLIPESGSMRLVTGVLLLSLLQPVDVAEQLAAVDLLSGGRLVFGAGLGYRDEEFEAFGVQRGERVARFLEALEVIRRLWTGGPVSHDGKHFHIHTEGAGLTPLQQPEPPIWLAAMSHVTLKRAAQQRAIAYLGPRVPEAEVRQWVDLFRAESGNPTARLPLRRELFIQASSSRAWEEAERHIGERFELYRQWGIERGLGEESLGGLRSYLQARIVAGDPTECSETLARCGEAGASVVVLRCLWPSLEPKEVRSMVELAGKAASSVEGA